MLCHTSSILSNAARYKAILRNNYAMLGQIFNRMVSFAVHSKTNLFLSLPDFKKVPIYHLSSIPPTLVLGAASLQLTLKKLHV